MDLTVEINISNSKNTVTNSAPESLEIVVAPPHNEATPSSKLFADLNLETDP